MNSIISKNTTTIKTPKERIIEVYTEVYNNIKDEDGLRNYIEKHGEDLYHNGSHTVAYYQHPTNSELTYDLCLDCQEDYKTVFFRSRLFCEDNETTILDSLEEGLKDMMAYVDEIEIYKR